MTRSGKIPAKTPPKASPKGSPPGKTSPAGRPEPTARTIASALGRKPPRNMAREMLLLETRRLRAVFTEIAERYLEETEGRIAAAISAIEATPLPESKTAKMLKIIQTLTVKARKGRRKDLARIERVTETLFKVLEE